MSKFLKFIVTIILIVFIGSGAALIVPQFVGEIDTFVVQEKMVSNRPVGMALFTKKESTSDLQVGDKILDMDTSTMYVHEVVSYDSVTQTAQVTGSTATTVRLSENYTRVLFGVPLIGYLTIATQSLPGLIILGILLGLVIFLFIASEILRRHPEEEEDEEESYDSAREQDEDDFYSGLAQRKRETATLIPVTESLEESTAAVVTDTESEYDGVEELAPPEGLFDGEAETGTAAEETPLAEATAETAAADEPAAEAAEEPEEQPVEAQPSPDGMLELSKGTAEEETAEGTEEKLLGTGELPDVQAALEAALENQQLNRTERPIGASQPILERVRPEEEIVVPDENGEIELAMPVFNKEELLSKAYADGLDPKVREDAANGITFVDYSDCL